MTSYNLTIRDCLKTISATKPETILTAISRGELRAINIGSGLKRPTWRISETDFETWLEFRSHRPLLAKTKRSTKAQTEPVVKFF